MSPQPAVKKQAADTTQDVQPTPPNDEFESRIRQLDAERLRPIPSRPKPQLEIAAEALLRRLKQTYEPEACAEPDATEPPSGGV